MSLLSISILMALLAAFLSYYFILSDSNIPSPASIHTSYAAFKPTYTPVALFVGGTSGLGQGIAEAFAKHIKGNAHIIITGHNRAAAEAGSPSQPHPT